MYTAGLLAAGAAALGYTFATFFLKMSLLRGATASQVNLWSNIAMALIVQPLWIFDDPLHANAPWFVPAITTVTFFCGQIFTFLALSHGDVSVATPVMGSKVILVTAINSIAFALPIPGAWWLAAVMASLGITVIAGVIPKGQFRPMLRTSLFAMAAALSFSLTDTLVQKWSAIHDPMAFLPAMFGGVGLLSVVYYTVTERKAFRVAEIQRWALGVGALLLGIQCALVFLSLTWSGDATATNVVYALRSLMTVVAARLLGRFFGLAEAVQSRTVLIARLVGALLLFASIALILMG